MTVSRTTRPKATLERISVRKTYDVLADKLRETILSGTLPEGSYLPSERELVDQTGLSRGSVREAIRKLEVEGLVRTQTGRFGGIVVSIPSSDVVAHCVAQFIRGRNLSNETLQQSREVVEPALARMAASQRTVEDLQEIRRHGEELNEYIDSPDDFVVAYINLHNAIGRASHNELLAAFLFSMSYGVLAATLQGDFGDREVRVVGVQTHESIVAAIADQDGDAAFRRMGRHLRSVASRTRSAEKLVLGMLE